MKLLFKRGQYTDAVTRTKFTLMAKVQFEGDEQQIVEKYRFLDSILVDVVQPNLIRNSYFFGFIVSVVSVPILALNFWREIGLGWVGVVSIAALIGAFVGWVTYHQFRETIFLKDLVLGRNFKCRSIVDLAQREAWLQGVTANLRQIMEAAKTWGGEVVVDIPALSGEDAIRMLQGKH